MLSTRGLPKVACLAREVHLAEHTLGGSEVLVCRLGNPLRRRVRCGSEAKAGPAHIDYDCVVSLNQEQTRKPGTDTRSQSLKAIEKTKTKN